MDDLDLDPNRYIECPECSRVSIRPVYHELPLCQPGKSYLTDSPLGTVVLHLVPVPNWQHTTCWWLRRGSL